MNYLVRKYMLMLGLWMLSACLVFASPKHKKKYKYYAPDNYSYNGIDVSHHNGTINWNVLGKNHRIKFIYIKATEGATIVDSEYRRNLKGARKAGFKVGSYHYFHMTSSPEEQFRNFINHVPTKKQDLIPMVDIETRDGYSIKRTQKALRKFIRLLYNYYGKKPIIYTTMSHYNDWLAPEFNRYHLSIGRYNNYPPRIKGKGTYTIWQYCETGKVKGIKGNVDLNQLSDKHTLKELYLK